MSSKKTRDPALDIIRCIAYLCVVCVHFFLYTGFYDTAVSGTHMLVMTIMRNSFLICVPLFMMLTGYLIQSEETNKVYYLKIVRIIYTYIIASLICGLYRIYFLGNFTVASTIVGILSFETIPYSWYIEMYIGFFLLIPFLNVMYNGLYTQRKKQTLIVTLLLLTALPGILNIYNVYYVVDPEWWLMPSKELHYSTVVPDWWAGFYPITYFFMGKYLREYAIKFKPKQIAGLSILVFLFAGIYNYYRSYGSTFVSGPWQEYGSFLITLQSACVFCFFINLKYDRLPAKIRKVLSKISDLSLGAYLSSWTFDSVVYSRLNNSILTTQQKLVWFPVAVALVFIGSLMCAYVIDLSYSFIMKIIHRRTSQAASN